MTTATKINQSNLVHAWAEHQTLLLATRMMIQQYRSLGTSSYPCHASLNKELLFSAFHTT